jgi:hypothetical protein
MQLMVVSRKLVLGAIASVTLAAVVVVAGPLNPPAGPVTSSYKTLSEVEPRIAINATNTPGTAGSLFRISQPGSYYLTGNITGVSGRVGIEIAADGVTLDLNGFALQGVGGSLDGILASTPVRSVSIRNGTVRGWGGDGIDLFLNSVTGGSIEHVHAFGNLAAGIRVGSSFVISNSTSVSNSQNGFVAITSLSISHCTASSNLGLGYSLGANATASNCIAYLNTGSGFTAANGSSLSFCVARNNQGQGFDLGTSCTITHCNAVGNNLNGIRVSSGCIVRQNNCDSNGLADNVGAGVLATGIENRIEANHCSLSDRGIEVTNAANLIFGNTCRGNTTNFAIAANNRYGPILNIPASGTAAVNGSSAASTLTTTDPFANFSY